VDAAVENPDSKPECIRLLQPFDIDQLIVLKTAANWNQLPSDWERLLMLQPDGCFGLFAGGRLAATATALTYRRDLAWIGMVLTLPEFRGRGYASRLMARCLQFLEASGVTEAKLDATSLGIEIYRRAGFADECPVERWERPPAPFDGARAPRDCAGQWPPELDWEAFGADRSALLGSLQRSGSVMSCESGYAMSRDGSNAAYLGPCVARDTATARTLLASLLVPLAGRPVYWDLFPSNIGAVAIAREFGFEPVRQLTRMSRLLAPERPRMRPEHNLVFCLAGFELG